MLTEERYSAILEILDKEKAVTVVQLTKELKISESTIRRDLTALHEMGRLKKVHGGAIANRNEEPELLEKDMESKTLLNIEEKDRIVKYAASLIKENEFVYIDAGSTTEKMTEYITQKQAVYVTNGLTHAKILARRGMRVFLIAGEFKAKTEAIVGVKGVESINKYNFTKCFIGTNGISKTAGYTTPDTNEACVKEAVIKRSTTAFILADASKFEAVSAVTFADIDDCVIITEELRDKEYRQLTVVKEVIE